MDTNHDQKNGHVFTFHSDFLQSYTALSKNWKH